MPTYRFSVDVVYDDPDEGGVPILVTESFVIDADSLDEARRRLPEHVQDYLDAGCAEPVTRFSILTKDEAEVEKEAKAMPIYRFSETFMYCADDADIYDRDDRSDDTLVTETIFVSAATVDEARKLLKRIAYRYFEELEDRVLLHFRILTKAEAIAERKRRAARSKAPPLPERLP